MKRLCRKIIGAAALTLAITPAWGDDPKSAVDFVLSTCLPAMDDPANVEKIAQEKGWSRLPDVLPLSTNEKSRALWQAQDFNVVITSYFKGTYHQCLVGFPPNKVERDGFFEAISIELTLELEGISATNSRVENYDIVGRNLKLLILSRDGVMRIASIRNQPQ